MIIGITGTLGAGKGTVVEFLKEKGFKHYSVREFLIKEMNNRGIEINLNNMAQIANTIRTENSPSYIIEKLYEKASQEGGNSIIESIRTPGEAEFLRQKKYFYLLAVDADPKIRYSRIISRQSEIDNISFDEFLEAEKKQMFSVSPYEQNLSVCISQSDFKLVNNKDLEFLKYHLNEILKKILSEKKELLKINLQETTICKRPSWDEYFLEIMHTVAKRATCDRGKTAVVAVKDRKIIATGYVGSPIGLPHCDEEGHLLHKVINEDDSVSQHCIRTIHGEQNVICQAAKYGIPLEGATLYMKLTPCFTCAKMIINAGIKRVVAEKKYHKDTYSLDSLKKAGVEVKIINEEIETYEHM